MSVKTSLFKELKKFQFLLTRWERSYNIKNFQKECWCFGHVCLTFHLLKYYSSEIQFVVLLPLSSNVRKINKVSFEFNNISRDKLIYQKLIIK